MRKHQRLGARHPPVASEPDISAAYKAAVEGALRWAWERVLAQWPEIAVYGREEQITECICRVLNEQGQDNKRLAPGLSIFETVNRGAKTVTADGRIEKAPDLVFRPIVALGVRHKEDWGVFVECKIIAPEWNHSPKIYCEQGVARFAAGEYARRMPSAAMLAYVRDGQVPHAALSSLLDATYTTQSHEAGVTTDTSKSRHGRGSLPHPCVDVTLTHLWLDARNGGRSKRRPKGTR